MSRTKGAQDKSARNPEGYKRLRNAAKGGTTRIVGSFSLNFKHQAIIAEILTRRGIIPNETEMLKFARHLLYGEIEVLQDDKSLII